MKSTFARKLLADLQECRALYPYPDAPLENSPRAQLLAARVAGVRIDTVAMLWDARFATPALTPATTQPGRTVRPAD